MNRSCIKALHLWASGASERKNVLRSSDRSFVAQARMSHDTLKVVAGGVLLSRQEVHLVNLSGHRPQGPVKVLPNQIAHNVEI